MTACLGSFLKSSLAIFLTGDKTLQAEIINMLDGILVLELLEEVVNLSGFGLIVEND
ncbi:hypothetical protein [uncultured Streptococcus sp.]|uniref:hypothetical protein n=1 Tax=uncultured Streptococcus sp. TaxID=83427 RepID=UPI0027DE553C|nr:hypothetical protein [uncultured Streptococcus sp.]